MMLSVVIPVFNEENRLADSLPIIIDYCKKNFVNDFEIIVVDDGSSDGTRSVVKKFGISNLILTPRRKNMGKGYSVKQGMLIAKGDFILFTDSDLSTPISELKRFMKFIEKSDIVIASRALKSSNVKTRFYKKVLGRVANLPISILIRGDIKDTQCGFKLFRRDVAKKLFSLQKIDRWGFDFEILFLAKKFKFRVKEVGVKWVEDEDSRVKLSDYPKTFGDIFKIRINNFKGRYK